MTSAECVKTMIKFAALFPSFTPSEATLLAYAEFFEDVSAEDFKAALLFCLKSQSLEFFPAASVILAAVQEVKRIQSSGPTRADRRLVELPQNEPRETIQRESGWLYKLFEEKRQELKNKKALDD